MDENCTLYYGYYGFCFYVGLHNNGDKVWNAYAEFSKHDNLRIGKENKASDKSLIFNVNPG